MGPREGTPTSELLELYMVMVTKKEKGARDERKEERRHRNKRMPEV